jgi:hypothetical protein
VVFRSLVIFAAITFLQRDLLATSCGVPPPCARVRPNGVFFVGVVLDAGVAETDQSPRNIRFKVEEVFTGLSTSTKEAVVFAPSSWLIKGRRYLIDSNKEDDGRLSPAICGGSGEVTEPEIAPVLDFLRQRAQGKTKTTLAVNIVNEYRPLHDVDVTVTGPEGILRSRTDKDGLAAFSDIKPGLYHVSAASEHYRVDPDSSFGQTIAVAAGTCASSQLELLSDGRVSGRVLDAKGAPVSQLKLDLVTAPDDASEELSLIKPFFETETDVNGHFTFESVVPGRYFLGSNNLGINSSTVPPTFYPGRRNRSGAIPVQLNLGDTAENLLFTLPDFGAYREIHLCVVNENGKSVAGAKISTDRLPKDSDDFASLGGNEITNQTGCVMASGYSKVAYFVNAHFRPEGGDIWQSQSSDSLLIEPGEDPVRRILVLRKPLGSLKRKQ